MNITVSFYDCCLPDYFGGHHLPVLSVPVDGNITRKELYNGLISELNEGVIDYTFEYQFDKELPYELVKASLKDCLYFNDSAKDSDVIFPNLEPFDDSGDDYSNSCFAYFVVNCEAE